MEPCTPYQNLHHHLTVVTSSQWGKTPWPYRVKLLSSIKCYSNTPSMTYHIHVATTINDVVLLMGSHIALANFESYKWLFPLISAVYVI